MQWGKQEPLVYHHREQKYIAAIDRAYSEAARTLLEVLINENDLMGRLRSVKNYFLLAQGDFVVSKHFIPRRFRDYAVCYSLNVFEKYIFRYNS